MCLGFFHIIKNDELVKSRTCNLSVIPAPVLRSGFATEGGKAGIQYYQAVIKTLNPVFHRGTTFNESIKNDMVDKVWGYHRGLVLCGQ